MRYVDDRAVIDPASGFAGTYTYRANDVAAPNLTSGGTHQPYGHDTMASVYTRYKVLSSKITATFYAPTGATDGVASIKLSTSGTQTTTATLALEQPGTTYKPLGEHDGPRGVVVLKKTFNAKRFWGPITGGLARDTSATFGASPVVQSFFHLGLMSGSNTGNYPSTRMHVTITYKVLCIEPKNLLQS